MTDFNEGEIVWYIGSIWDGVVPVKITHAGRNYTVESTKSVGEIEEGSIISGVSSADVRKEANIFGFGSVHIDDRHSLDFPDDTLEHLLNIKNTPIEIESKTDLREILRELQSIEEMK